MMKRILYRSILLFSFLIMVSASNLNAQSDAGTFLLGVNTGFGGLTGFGNVPANTGFYLQVGEDDESIIAFGAEAAFFPFNDFALRGGLGFVSFSSGENALTSVVYKIGGQYYVNGRFPIGADVVGYTDDAQSSFIGLQAGYVIPISGDILLEPGLRYNITMDNDKSSGFFQMNAGISILLN